jgi:hypothetical protein
MYNHVPANPTASTTDVIMNRIASRLAVRSEALRGTIAPILNAYAKYLVAVRVLERGLNNFCFQ